MAESRKSREAPKAKATKKQGRPMCEPPRGLKTRFCHGLDAVLIEDNARRAGVYAAVWTFFKTMKSQIIGVAARASAKVSPVMFNFCPYCGEKIFFHKDPKAAAEHYKAIGYGRPGLKRAGRAAS